MIIKKLNLRLMSIFGNIPTFRHLKLEIASAIPASNDETYEKRNSAAQW